MSIKLKYVLNNQLFGDDDGSGGGDGGNPNQNATVTIDYEKLASIVSKKSTLTEDKVLHGYFKNQGLSPEEADEAMKTFKEQRLQKTSEEKDKLKNLEVENAKLKAQMNDAKVNNALSSKAIELGISAEKLPFALKLVERKDLLKEDETIDDEKVKSSLEELLKAFPEIKGAAESNGNGFQQLGSGGSSAGNSAVDAQLDAIFGLKK